MMKQHLRLFLLTLLSLSLYSGYGQIYSYTSDTAGNYNSIAANTTALKLTRYNGLTRPGTPCGTGFSSTTFVITATTYADSLTAVEADVTANNTYQLNVTDFSVGLRRSASGPVKARLAYSIDGGATWVAKSTDDSPNNAGCGVTTTATWTTPVTVPSTATLKFRVYLFNAGNAGGLGQILNLVINGTVTSSNTISTTAAAFGPYCQGTSNNISVPFTTVGTFTGQYYVQLSDASGVFPSDATSNLISTGTGASPASATLPANTAAGAGYRVRVVNQTPTYYTSGDNGSNIVINPTIVPSVTVIDSPTAVCPGSPVRFSVATTSGGGASPTYQWYVQGAATGTGTSYTSSALSNNDSVYAVLTSNALCASPTTAKSNTLRVTIYPTRTSDVYDTICPGASVVFGGNTQTATGNYVAHVNTVNGCDSTVTLHLFVLTTKRAAVNASICQGDSYTFNGNTYSAAGSYADTVRCDSIATLVLSIKTTQRTSVSASICPGDSYSFNGTSYNTAGTYSDTVRCDSIVTLTLSIKTVHTTTLTGSICQGDSYLFNGTTYSAAGTYSDTVRCDSIVTLTLIVNPKPNAVATLTGTTQLSTTAFASYQWLLNGGAVSGASSQNYTAVQNGSYTVAVTDANGCKDTSNAVAVTLIAISEVNTLNARIYPSPTEGLVNIDAENLSSIEVVDMIGRTIISLPLSKNSNHAQVDLTGYTNGIYTLIIHGADNAV
jgi:hypothetical protein